MESRRDGLNEIADYIDELEIDRNSIAEKLGELEESVLHLRTLAMECENAYNFLSMEMSMFQEDIEGPIKVAIDSMLYRAMRLFDFVASDEALKGV